MSEEQNNNNQNYQHEQHNQGYQNQQGQPVSSDIAVVSDMLPDILTVLPVDTRPFFPGITVPMTFTGPKFIEAIKNVANSNQPFLGLVLVKEPDQQDFMNSEMYEVGTVVKIHKIVPVQEDSLQVLVQGLQRFSYVKSVRKDPVLQWQVEYYSDPDEKPSEELKAYTLSIVSSVKELLKKNPVFQEQIKMVLNQISIEKPGMLMDLITAMLTADGEKLQDILATYDLYKRAEKLLVLLKEEIERSQIQEEIQKQINEKVSKQQREFFLREQLKVIKRELGIEKDDKESEIQKFKDRMKNLKLSQEASEVINSEIEKMQTLEPSSSEFQVTRAYLNTLTELPWGIYSQDRLDIQEARRILDRDHYGLKDVKNRILEFISTVIKKGKHTGTILCLVGPPGVGKTSVGRSIADSMNRKFFRFSVGGMRDEAEIKGHRRTYIGAMPGKVIQSLKRTGTSNPVIMLDEIDKMGVSFQGDPASALLEVLDPEQNKDFLDHYLDVRYDLSNILFITTANQLDTVPQPLLDRMEVIKLPGYILQEKVQIAKKYLIPRQIKEHGLKKSEVNISDEALRRMIDEYAREAGVRSLEKNIAKVMRQVTLRQSETGQKRFSITKNNLEKYLGNPVFTTEKLYTKKMPGVSLGLAWTSMGGTTMYVEASAVKSKQSGFKQTGQLGKVMEESSEIAYSYVRSLLCELNGNEDGLAKYFKDNFIHLHVPAGATPKDGPSAGITMALALYSLATNKPVRQDLAMTGELTLTGKVLPIGGIREKTIAARRVGVYNLIFPKDNQKDFEELPDYLKKGIKPHFVDYFDDVLDVAYNHK
ncbi:MAG: endopeptidase La [Bacteroidales bacterium]|nr:endopeptidase La [Bacteroidales bacterium]